ncbi:hypothetical protein NL676_031485 [Syzygium grande]|nr:hypothetical protein NL676_031485 [Syzygium grande]
MRTCRVSPSWCYDVNRADRAAPRSYHDTRLNHGVGTFGMLLRLLRSYDVGCGYDGRPANALGSRNPAGADLRCTCAGANQLYDGCGPGLLLAPLTVQPTFVAPTGSVVFPSSFGKRSGTRFV